jgi:hypothetical protein
MWLKFFSPFKRHLDSYKLPKYEVVTAMLICVPVAWVNPSAVDGYIQVPAFRMIVPPRRCRMQYPRKIWYRCTNLHDIISKKIGMLLSGCAKLGSTIIHFFMYVFRFLCLSVEFQGIHFHKTWYFTKICRENSLFIRIWKE